MKRMVYIADNGDCFVSDISSGLSNIGAGEGVTFFKTHTGIKAYMEIGRYVTESRKGKPSKLVWECDITLG